VDSKSSAEEPSKTRELVKEELSLISLTSDINLLNSSLNSSNVCPEVILLAVIAIYSLH
jgi:hypothetical protein